MRTSKMSNAFLFSCYGMIAITLGFSCDETEDHCFTSLDIRYAKIMNENQAGQVYAKNGKLYSQETNVPVPIDNVITADGRNLTRILITANGTMPGPTIYLYQNQTITILVNNLLINETVTVHWHGIDQLAHPAMDGVAYLSQCPILPGHSFNYTFQPRFGGSYWYHSHVGIQRDMGLYGAFIVLLKTASAKESTNHIIQIQEWNNLFDAMTLYLDDKVDDTPHSILINGRGQLKDILAPIETFNVKQGNSYLFRLIGVGSHRTLLFSIPGLQLTVVETDGFEIVPSVVDKIIIFPAERYDFEIDLSSAEEKIYNITVSILSSPDLTIGDDIGLGFLNVTKEDSQSTVIFNLGTTFLVLNCPFQTYPHREDLICIPLTDLKPQNNVKDDYVGMENVKKTNETSLLFLNFGFPDDISSINGHSFRWPTVASLLKPSETNTDCDECNDEKTCNCSYSLNLKSGSEVIMVLSTLGKGATISHPIHMHGHTFEVLKMVFPEVTDDFNFVFTNDIKCSETKLNNQSQCNNAKWRNASWNNYKNIPGINFNNPIRKDTIVVPYGGYIIIRINATNPGVWFLHCHIDKHMAEGMAVMLNESFEHQQIYIPKEFPTCHSYLKTPSGVVNEADTISDPCLTYKVLDTPNEDARSVANAALPSAICDNTLEAGWYRITSYAGERMPTECVYGGMRCGTSMSIWMNGAYPDTGDVKTVQACAAHYDGDCCKHSYDIEVKNCTDYLVYNLVPVSSCYQAYCFGSELACPAGETSDNNGFTPGCRYEPCLEENHQSLDHWERSVNNTEIGNLCDNTLTPGWYRPISAVGNTMPTECPQGGYKCGTSSPIWMDGSYPSSGEIANVTACVGNYNGGCCTSSYDMQVKNCDDFYIYNLKPTSGCYQAYCFGTEVKCPVGETSDNEGFTPGCEFDPCHSSNYGILEGEMKRSSNYTLQTTDVAIEDSRLTTGWYKIDSVTGNDIVNDSVVMMQCGTLYPLWMEGSLPDVSDKTVDRKVCQSGLYSTCDQEYDIKVRNCGTYRTYYLTQLNVDKSAYCFGTFPVPDPTTTTPPTTRRTPPGNHPSKEDDENDKDDKPYIWVIVGMLAVLSTILLAILLVKVFLQRTASKRAVSFVNVNMVKEKCPSYEEATQNDKNNRLLEINTVGQSAPVNQFTVSTASVPPNSTNFGQMKRF